MEPKPLSGSHNWSQLMAPLAPLAPLIGSILAPFCVLFYHKIRMHMAPLCIRCVSFGSIDSIDSINWLHLLAP